MKKFYISPKDEITEFGKYSRRFYHQVLKDMGYIHIDSRDSIVNILTAISSKDHTHIELAISQKKEIEILLTMLRANYRNVSVTVHDAPFIKHPFYEFRNPVFNKISKFFNRYTNTFGAPNSMVRKIKAIYVLSRQEIEMVKAKYKIQNVYYLPVLDDKTEAPAVRKEIYDSLSMNNSTTESKHSIIL